MATRVGRLRGPAGVNGASGKVGQRGPASAPVVVGKTSVTTDDGGLFSVTFDKPFPSPPVVYPFANAANGAPGYHIAFSGITAEGFTGKLRVHGAGVPPVKNGTVTMVYTAQVVS